MNSEVAGGRLRGWPGGWSAVCTVMHAATAGAGRQKREATLLSSRDIFWWVGLGADGRELRCVMRVGLGGPRIHGVGAVAN